MEHMQTRIKVAKDGMTLLDIPADMLVLSAMMRDGTLPQIPFTVHVTGPLGDEIRLVRDKEDV